MSAGMERIASETLDDLKAAQKREQELFDRWHALARAVISDNNHGSLAWQTLAAQVGA